MEEFNFLKLQAVEPMATFMDYITYGYMIDNIVLVITGTHHDRETNELLEKCYPLTRTPTLTLTPTPTPAPAPTPTPAPAPTPTLS